MTLFAAADLGPASAVKQPLPGEVEPFQSFLVAPSVRMCVRHQAPVRPLDFCHVRVRRHPEQLIWVGAAEILEIPVHRRATVAFRQITSHVAACGGAPAGATRRPDANVTVRAPAR